MLVTTTAGTWGITGAQFLWGYGALCAATAAGMWHTYRRALGPPAGPLDPVPELPVCQIGLLNEGPDCATTAAAARLCYDGILRAEDGTLAATGELDATADPIEREVFATVSREPRLSARELRDRVANSATMVMLREQMTRAGLLLDEPQTRVLRHLWIVPALVTALGILRIVAGVADGRPVLWLAVMTAVAGLATVWLATTMWLISLRPGGTRRGRDMLERLRRHRGDRTFLLSQASAGQIALAAALYGAGTLWLAESAIASALGVPREEDPSVGSHGGGGGCGGGDGGGGCGGCGGCGG